MTKERYERTVRFFTKNKTANLLLRIIYMVLPLSMFIAYPFMLIIEFFILGFCKTWLELALIPLGTLILVSVLRVVINEQRPYEKYGIPSVFEKDTVGKSMPSRHTASAFVIAMTFFYGNKTVGIVGLVFALLIELSRILAGAHYIRDVVAGAAIGIAAGCLFWII